MAKYSDDYLLAHAHLGPGILGKSLHSAVQEAVARRKPDAKGNSVYGPALLGPAVEVEVKAPKAKRVD